MMTTDIALIASIAGFATLFLFGVGVIQHSRQKAVRRQLVAKIRMEDETIVDAPGALDPEGQKRPSANPLLRLLHALGKRYAGVESAEYSASRKRFLKAGIRWEGAPSAFWSVKILAPSLLVLLFVFLRLSVFKMFAPNQALSMAILLGVAGFYLPDFWLYLKTSARKERLFEGLPDALDLMVVCVEAGMGLDAAINRVGKEMALSNRVLSDEFKLLNLELRAGKKRTLALRNLALRTDLEDLNSLVTLLIQADRFGTSIAQSLRVFADSFRSKRFQRAEEIAAKMPVKLIFPLILFIFPTLMVVIVGPAAIRIYQNLLMH
jgi:tight adherence protein C